MLVIKTNYTDKCGKKREKVREWDGSYKTVAKAVFDAVKEAGVLSDVELEKYEDYFSQVFEIDGEKIDGVEVYICYE